MARLLKILVATLVVAALVVGAYFWLQSRGEKDEEFKLVKVERGEITEKAVAVGQIEPRLKFEVKSKISGIVKRCVVDVGDRVNPGDPLFEIAPDPTPTELVEAESQVHTAEAGFRRAEAE
ncbi:MAG: biotin/lipoyl-binding protein, partial [Thermoanaerobaculia bacterium]